MRRAVSRCLPERALQGELRSSVKMLAFRVLLARAIRVNSALLGEPLNASYCLLAGTVVPGPLGVQAASLAAAMRATGNDPTRGLRSGSWRACSSS